MPDEKQTDLGRAAPPQTKEEVGRSPTNARKAAEDLLSAAGATVDEYCARGKEVWDEAVDRVRSFQDDGKQYVRKNPTKAVFAALGIGLVLGLILRR